MRHASPAVRRILYVSGTRADFGLMRSTLCRIDQAPDLRLSVLVTGMHLDRRYGHTVDEIEAAGLQVAARIPLVMQPETAATMARNIGRMTEAFVEAIDRDRPEVVLLLGDRGEMLAGAIAALHLGATVVHIHGGERSGTVDEAVRHAVSKLSHVHLVATEGSRERLIRMGEPAGRVIVTGAPGLDGLAAIPREDRATLCRRAGLDAGRPVALMVFHPVVQEAEAAGQAAREVLGGVLDSGCQVLALMPNADAGGAAIREVLGTAGDDARVRVVNHLQRDAFVAWMAAADLMVGNSSAGIIEAASFGTPVLNIGSRQNLRERNANVVDVAERADAIAAAAREALRRGRHEPANVYGDGQAGARIVAALRALPPDLGREAKVNAY